MVEAMKTTQVRGINALKFEITTTNYSSTNWKSHLRELCVLIPIAALNFDLAINDVEEPAAPQLERLGSSCSHKGAAA